MSSEALAKPTITKNSSEFKQDAYASLPTGELVVFAVQVLQADAAPVAVEEVVSTCFRLFPHSFALKNYFYWQDSALVARRLHDAKEKGLLKGNSTDGYETKGSGKQVAKQVAKTLGVSLPLPPKVEVVVPPVVEAPKVAEVVIEKKEEEKKEVASFTVAIKESKKQETKKKPVKAEKKVEKKATAKKPVSKKPRVQVKPKKEAATPVKKKTASKPKTEPKKTIKAIKPAPKPKAEAKPLAKVEKKEEKRKKNVQSTVKPEVKKATPKIEKTVEKKQETSRKETKPTVKPEIKKVEPRVEKVTEKVEKQKKETKAQPKQLTMELAPAAAWKKAEAPASKPKVKNEALPVKGEVLAPVAASKEEKDKAAKVIKQIERSDAYQLYKRNGKRAQIGEFDFRNMLFATMESSPETLKRNLDLFKRYAGIHFRTDLIAFLEFCEESFAALMISKVKGKK